MKGFSLLEVLIAMLILSIGLLGFARAQIISLRHNENAYQLTIAETQNNSLAEYLRACDITITNSTCSSQQIANWKNENKTLLPQAKSNALITGNHYTLTLNWHNMSGNTSTILQTPL